MFVRSIDQKEKDEDSAKMERVCRRHDEREARILSTMVEPTIDGRMRTRQVDPLPPKDMSLAQKGTTVLNMEAFVREAYESLRV